MENNKINTQIKLTLSEKKSIKMKYGTLQHFINLIADVHNDDEYRQVLFKLLTSFTPTFRDKEHYNSK